MKILFIIHDASNTGAPFVMYNFLKKFVLESDNISEILLLNGGPLVKDFKALCRVHVLEKRSSLTNRVLKKLKLISSKSNLQHFLDNSNYDLYYFNSLASISSSNIDLSFLNSRQSILHVHELENSIKRLKWHNSLTSILSQFKKVICVSKLVEENLKLNHKLDISKSQIIFPISRLVKSNILKSYDYNSEFIIGGCGHIDFTKGLDVFLTVASRVLKSENLSRKIKFYWLGNDGNEHILNHIKADIIKLGIEDDFCIFETTNKPLDFFKKINLFFLSSREDSFPLVAIENFKLGNPIMCFEKATGFSDLINESNGFVIPYLDIEIASKMIINLSNNPGKEIHLRNKIVDDNKFLNNDFIYQHMLKCFK